MSIKYNIRGDFVSNKLLNDNNGENSNRLKKLFIVILTVLFPFIGIFFIFKSGYFNKKGKTAATIWLGVILLGLFFSPGQEQNIASNSNQAKQSEEVDQENNEINSEEQSLLNEILEGDNEMTKKDKANYKAIRDFIDNNKSLGKFTYFEKKEPWMHGDRYSVSTKEDTFLFYLYNEENKVVSVNVKDQNGNIQNIYREEVPNLPDNFKRKATEEVPEYIIIDQFDLMSGGRHGDILIKSFSKETPLDKREKVIKKIIEKENFTQADLYCTREAFEANMNSSYSESHPNALENGYLGSVRDNKFSAPYN
jgi:hypothetical protein